MFLLLKVLNEKTCKDNVSKICFFFVSIFPTGGILRVTGQGETADRQTDGQTDRSVKGSEDEVGPTENKNFGRSHSDKYADLNRTLTIFAKIKQIFAEIKQIFAKIKQM